MMHVDDKQPDGSESCLQDGIEPEHVVCERLSTAGGLVASDGFAPDGKCLPAPASLTQQPQPGGIGNEDRNAASMVPFLQLFSKRAAAGLRPNSSTAGLCKHCRMPLQTCCTTSQCSHAQHAHKQVNASKDSKQHASCREATGC